MTRGAPIPDTVMLHVPFRIVKRGGRKEMQLPEGATQSRRIIVSDNSRAGSLSLGKFRPAETAQKQG